MPFILLAIGLVIVVSAIRGTQGTLLSALAQDVPAYGKWAAAIVTLGAIGFIPQLKPVSRALIALVLIVLVLRNYQAILAGFSHQGNVSVESASPSAGSASSPAQAGAQFYSSATGQPNTTIVPSYIP
jgi:hypothetical protein